MTKPTHSRDLDIAELTQSVNDIDVKDVFPNWITHIRFPHFKNIQPNSKIDFTYPITALVGPNGTGKSSVLQALYGAPEGQSVEDFWFSTAIDPIEEGGAPDDAPGSRARFIYGHYLKTLNKTVEVMKSRIRKERNPNYWEPSRPILAFGMDMIGRKPILASEMPFRSATRWNGVNKAVVYLDFRSELGAFHKALYFSNPPSAVGARSNQEAKRARRDFLIKRSSVLRNYLEEYWPPEAQHYGRQVVSSFEKLSKQQCERLSFILGKEIVGAKIVEHSLFNEHLKTAPQRSVVFRTKAKPYSDAFAGAGEIAATAFVLALDRISESGALILLDEPEVSLHPTAQRNLLAVLLDFSRRGKHQVVMATHSPYLVESLPPKAIKLFQESGQSGYFFVSQNVPSNQAFFSLGHHSKVKTTIFVEDVLAKLILDRIGKTLGEWWPRQFEVVFHPGGNTFIRETLILAHMHEVPHRHFVVLDGDCMPVDGKPIVASNTFALSVDLSAEIQRLAGGQSVKFNLDTNSPGQARVQRAKYIDYFDQCVLFLPHQIPEQIILELNGVSADKDEAKQKLLDLAISEFDESSSRSVEMFAKKVLTSADRNASLWLAIREILTKIQSHSHN